MTALFMKEISLTLKVGAATAVEFNCHLSQAIIEADPPDVVTYNTLCAGGTMSRTGSPVYALHLIGVQDWATTPQGLANYLAANAGQLATFVYNAHGVTPIAPSPATPAFTGTCQLLAPAYGGEVNTWAEFDVTLPITGKPTQVVSLAELERALKDIDAEGQPIEAEPKGKAA